MGILPGAADLVRRLALPAGFSVCELGDQWMSGLKAPQLAADWYRSLGCGTYASIDGNGRASFTHDLNTPLPFVLNGTAVVKKWRERFDLVTDFGTSEHIFDQAQVWRTIHDLTKPGGYIVFDRPNEGYPGHCYYRVDRCLLEDVAAANHYAVLTLETCRTPRGVLIRGVFRRPTTDAAFVIPQQGRYQKTLVI